MKKKQDTVIKIGKALYLFSMLLCLVSGCTSEFDLELEKNEQRLVVEGWITNLPEPQLLRLTKTMANMKPSAQWDPNTENTVEPVTDALVIIRDNTGIADTLKPKPSDKENPYYNIQNGYYETSKLQGIPGRTYTLYIKAGGKEYHASAYMPPVPAIDSVSYIDIPNPMKNENMLVPTISFREPQETRNYYLFRLHEFYSSYEIPNMPYPTYGGGGNNWGVSILSDALLPAYVKDYPIDDGVSPTGQDFYYLMHGQQFRVDMYSLTKDAYDFYISLISQFNNDGGAYQPVPASPPTNISNGAVGFFGASAVSYKVGKVE